MCFPDVAADPPHRVLFSSTSLRAGFFSSLADVGVDAAVELVSDSGSSVRMFSSATLSA